MARDAGVKAPIWRRLHVLVEPAAGGTPAPGERETRDAGASGNPGDEDEPTQDSNEWNRGPFASSIMNATGIAVRNTKATEVVFVAPRPMLALLRQRLGGLLRLGVRSEEIVMDPTALVSSKARDRIPRWPGVSGGSAGLLMTA